MSSPEDTNYPCYAPVEGAEIRQGDLLDHCPVVVFLQDTAEEIETRQKELDTDIGYCNVVIMSQTCDLMYDKLDLVLVCPVWTFEQLAEEHGHLRKTQVKLDLQRGNLPGYHLLNECQLDGFQRPVSIVDFRNVYSLPLDFIRAFAGARSPRLRLMPPYREHLAQAFARFFMRVGLPSEAKLP